MPSNQEPKESHQLPEASINGAGSIALYVEPGLNPKPDGAVFVGDQEETILRYFDSPAVPRAACGQPPCQARVEICSAGFPVTAS